MMVRINSMFNVKDEADAQQVKQMARQLIEQSRLEEGNLSYDLFQGSSPTCLLFCETWLDNDAFKAHVASQHYTTIMPKIKQLIVGNKDLKIFEYE